MLCHPLFAQTGEIYGNIRAKNISMATMTIDINNNSGVARSTKPDNNGNYRLKKLIKGKYTLKISSGRTSLGSIIIYSYQNPVRCNLLVEKVNNVYRIRRL